MRFFLAAIICTLITINSLAQTTPVPYNNSFDYLPQNLVGWTHYATSGTDDWDCGQPSFGQYFSSAYSSPNVWSTNLTGPFAANSDRSLETPYFDLSSTLQPYVMSFDYKKQINSNPSSFRAEYKVGANGAWAFLDDAAMNKKFWQTPSNAGFGNSSISLWRSVALELSFLQGQDSVKFRFRVVTNYQNGAGVLIDNFRIDEEYNNVVATQGDTISGVNQYFSDFTVQVDFNFYNEFNDYYPFEDHFYFSTDAILDAGDQYLGDWTHNSYTALSSNRTFALPTGLTAGYYYIFHVLDATDVLAENDETDNENYTVLKIDPIYTANYSTDFDSIPYEWNSQYGVNGSAWKRGDADNWHIEEPRSGSNAWASGDVGQGNYLVSPFIDLSTSVNSVVCFWYKTSEDYSAPTFKFQKPYAQGSTIGPTSYQSGTFIPATRYYGWDCRCEDISEFDGELSRQFRFFAAGETTAYDHDQSQIDDVYIGEAKPDLGIGGERDNRYTSASSATDTLNYTLFNSGLSALPASVSEFYWSNDSIFDASDILLGSKAEAGMTDTSFVEGKFEYSKPTLVPGEYFIIYNLDSGNTVDEMREYDNVGYFRIHQTQQFSLPYLNDFETQIDGWRHISTMAADEWEWGVPSGTVLDTAISGVKVFVTNADSLVGENSRMHLYSPVFDLSQLAAPFLEFDLKGGGYYDGFWNIMYSTDGGNSWNESNSNSPSFKKAYSRVSYSNSFGSEALLDVTSAKNILYGKYLIGLPGSIAYQGRDYDETTHHVIDLDFIQGAERVQFMFVQAHGLGSSEGIFVDNFSISNSFNDLKVVSNKKLLVSSSDYELKTYFNVKNNSNTITLSNSMNLYLSSDDQLDASDFLFHSESLAPIMPFAKRLVNIKKTTPVNYGQYNYLIYELDPLNLIAESDEANNIGYLELSMDSASNYNYPVEYDFELDEIDGWTWWHDSSGFYNGHRFRHQVIQGEQSIGASSGYWFMDRQNNVSSLGLFPIMHLETPVFDFSNLSIIDMTFDYIAMTSTSQSSSQGGNLHYSIDGGQTWIILGYTQDPYAQNWYGSQQLGTIGNEVGWYFNSNWTPASINLSFLAGEPNVRFRFKWKGTFQTSGQSVQGFRLDNFVINGKVVDLIASLTHPTISVNAATQQSFPMSYEIENAGVEDVLSSETNFYWSTDTILDAGDQLMYVSPESVLPANSVITQNQTIYYPQPIGLNEYYVIYYVDAGDTVYELNESNNVSWSKIVFSDSLSPDLESIPLISPLTAVAIEDYFYFEFDYINLGSMTSDSAEVLVHWSIDSVFDASDELLYTIEEPGLAPLDYITHAGNVYYPHPVPLPFYYLLISTDQANVIQESNETNNFVWIKVFIDTTGVGIDEVGELSAFSFINGQDDVIITSRGISADVDVVLRNAAGQVIAQKSALINEDSPISILKPSMAAGAYFLSISNGNSFHVFKIIQHEKH